MANTAIQRLTRTSILLSALLGATAANSDDFPISEVDRLCSQAMPSLEAYVDAFQDHGWREMPLSDLPDQAREDLIITAALANISGNDPYSRDSFTGTLSMTERQVTGIMMLPGYSSLLVAPATQAHSPLLIVFDPSVPKRLKIDCILAGKSAELDDWLTGLLDANRLRDDYFDFDPSEANTASEHLSPAVDDRDLNISAMIRRVSAERAERFLDRPLEYDLLFTVATTFKQEG